MKTNGLNQGHIWGLVAVLTLFFTLGSCCACLGDGKTEYGTEELYVTSGGQIKSAPHTTRTGSDTGLIFMTLIGGVVFVISFSGWMLTSTTGRELMDEAGEASAKKAAADWQKRNK